MNMSALGQAGVQSRKQKSKGNFYEKRNIYPGIEDMNDNGT